MRIRRDAPIWAAARVAAIATAIAALIYAGAATGIVLLEVNYLTQQVDDALAAELHILQERPTEAVARAEGRSHGGAAVTSITWVVAADGQLISSPTVPALPSRYMHTEGPATVTLEGHHYRLAGVALLDGWLVLGFSTDFIDYAVRALLIEAAVLGVPFLVLVFFAALAIGRSSAAPIERARKRLLEFTADASHELRTPLQVIEAEVSLALLQDRSAVAYREAIENIGRESGRLRALVEDLLWLARFDNRPGQPRMEVVDLDELAADAVERFRAPAEQKRQRLQLVAGRQAQAHVLAPREWLDRLLGVLLDNACRYTPEGGVIRVTVGSGGGQAWVRVEDSGPGIPAAERERIFERFHRANDSAGGSGLGLSIGSAVVQATRGRWQVGDSPEGGASMAVYWPVVRGSRGATRIDPYPASHPSEERA